MAIRAYSQNYVENAARALGNMLHCAVVNYEFAGDEFLQMFIQSGIAAQFEAGHPKYVIGKSGSELCFEVIGQAGISVIEFRNVEADGRSSEYWAGWILAYYQWYSLRSFESILEVISYSDLIHMYRTLHEADIIKAFEVFDECFANEENKLKALRKCCGLTQAELAKRANIPLSTLRAYEQGSKDINKAQVDTVYILSRVLNCSMVDLLDLSKISQ